MAYVSVGSNIDREANIRAAVHALGEHYGELQVSSVYESAAVGFDGRDFYNLVVGFDTSESPAAVARTLKTIENAQGRKRGGPRFSDRTLDLDLILYGSLVTSDGHFTLPRPEILEHAFVLGPLADVAAHRLHPVTGRTFGDLWASFDKAGQTMRKVNISMAQARGTAGEP